MNNTKPGSSVLNDVLHELELERIGLNEDGLNNIVNVMVGTLRQLVRLTEHVMKMDKVLRELVLPPGGTIDGLPTIPRFYDSDYDSDYKADEPTVIERMSVKDADEKFADPETVYDDSDFEPL